MYNKKKFTALFLFTKTAGKDGQGTLLFQNGEFYQENGFLHFSYISASQKDENGEGEKRVAIFDTRDMLGYSYTEIE